MFANFLIKLILKKVLQKVEKYIKLNNNVKNQKKNVSIRLCGEFSGFYIKHLTCRLKLCI